MSGVRIGSLFSGAGMLDEGVRSVIGGDVAWHAEVDPGACKVLVHRYPDVPNLGDVTTVDWAAVEPVDVITGGSPCQDVSHAGKRAGMRAGTRSGLWASMVDAIDVIRPSLVVWENVRGVLSAEADSAMERCAGCVGDGDDGPILRALGRVLGDLASIGYDTRWCGLRAADVGAPHGRYRVFVVATDAQRFGRDGWPHDARWESFFGAAVAGSGANAFTDADGGQQPRTAAARDGLRIAAERGGEPWWFNSGPAVWRRDAIADASCDARDQGWPESAGLVGGFDVAVSGAAIADTDYAADHGQRSRTEPEQGGAVDWGDYGAAIQRWERVTRPAPAPTTLGSRGGQRLSPYFTEWMMGWPAGWVTDTPGVTRNDALKICGNGVVPQQAAEALRRLLAAPVERAA